MFNTAVHDTQTLDAQFRLATYTGVNENGLSEAGIRGNALACHEGPGRLTKRLDYRCDNDHDNILIYNAYRTSASFDVLCATNFFCLVARGAIQYMK